MYEDKTDLALKISTLTVLDISEDNVIRAFGDIESAHSNKAVSAYFTILKTLALNNKTLSEYIHDLIVYGEFPLMYKCYVEKNDNIYKMLTYDLLVLSDLFKFDSEAIKNKLIKKFNVGIIKNAPSFTVGNFNFDVDYFIQFQRKNGIGIYARYKTFYINNKKICPIKIPDTITFKELKKYEYQISKLKQNTESFISGVPAQNALLYGDRGTGKSSAVKALVNEYKEIRIIGLSKSDIYFLGELYEELSKLPLKFILFFDDLTFNPDELCYHDFKQILEGSLIKKPENILIYATTNRRHLVREKSGDRDRDVFHRGDDLDDITSLADRFGLYITYSVPDKELYLQIVKALASEKSIPIDEGELILLAERFAISKGGRSPRAAKQFIDILEGRGVI